MSALDLDSLLVLQDIDIRTDQERHRKANLPERAEMADLERSFVAASAKRAELAAVLEEVAGRQAAAENELEVTEQRIKMVNDRLFGGGVSASRDLQAMSHDVEGLRRRASDLEDKVLALMDEREPLDAAVAAVDEELAHIKQSQAAVCQRLARAEADLDLTLEELVSERERALSVVPSQLLPTYERLRARLGGVAVARLVGGRCDGCHLALPAMELDRVMHHPTGSLEYCEQCGRILVVAAQAV